MINLWVWFGVACVGLLIEFFTLKMIAIWLAPAGIIAMAISALKVQLVWQIIVFVAVIIAFLLLVREKALRYINKGDVINPISKNNLGKKYRLTTPITKQKYGTINIYEKTCKVISINGEEMETGQVVKLVAISKNKYVIEKVENI